MSNTVLRPDTTFVLWLNAFSHTVEGGYRCSVWEGQARKVGDTQNAADALAYLAAHPTTVVSVIHV